jgi:hypothetical protein
MTDEKKPAAVTRGELYPILGMVHLLIACALLGAARHDQSILMLVANYLFLAVALASSITFSILGMHERAKGRIAKRDVPEPPDRPRD